MSAGIDDLDPELQRYLLEDGRINHPLIAAYLCPAWPAGRINEQFEQKKTSVADAERNGDWRRCIFLHEKPYRVRPLRKALRNIDDPALAASLVADVWIDSENIRQQLSVWKSIWNKLPSPRATMSENDRNEFATLPNRFPIFRGQRRTRRGITGALSWTTNQTKAQRFATGDLGKGFIASGLVHKSDVFAYFTGRDESEVVAQPDKIRSVVVREVSALPPGEVAAMPSQS
jgi:hypothetical protein